MGQLVQLKTCTFMINFVMNGTKTIDFWSDNLSTNCPDTMWWPYTYGIPIDQTDLKNPSNCIKCLNIRKSEILETQE